jgi:uncharacterized protein (TIGR00156 family)
MKRYEIFLFCLVLFYLTGSVFAQPAPRVNTNPVPQGERFGFTGPQAPGFQAPELQKPADRHPPVNRLESSRPPRPADRPEVTAPQRRAPKAPDAKAPTDRRAPAHPQRPEAKAPADHRAPDGTQRPQVTTYPLEVPTQTATVTQVRTFPARTPVLMKGNLVMAVAHNLYTFRDSSGEINVRIGPIEWQRLGSNIGPSDTVEILGALFKDEKDASKAPEVHVRNIKKL